jgi:hypothetical protein
MTNHTRVIACDSATHRFTPVAQMRTSKHFRNFVPTGVPKVGMRPSHHILLEITMLRPRTELVEKERT